ncbi:hypothetical protein ACKWTF_000789 [Chironomus riparius]
MWSKLRILKNLSKIEICGVFIAWLYLCTSIIVVIVGSVMYAMLMLDYWKIRSEPFPGMLILMCAIFISIAILIIWISFDMLYGIKNKNHKEVWKFRLFSLLCLVISFVLLPISLFELQNVSKWMFDDKDQLLKIPTFDILLLILVYHMIIFIFVDMVYDDYKKYNQEQQKQEVSEVSDSNLSQDVDNIMLHTVEIH